MKINHSALSDPQWSQAGINLPAFHVPTVTRNTHAAPTWIHFGAGNIFRAFPAAIHQSLLNRGLAHTGIIVAEGYDYEIIDALFAKQDNLSLLVALKAQGTLENTLIASITEALKMDSQNAPDFSRLKEIFRAPSLQMASFTITEKGYSLQAPGVESDMTQGPSQPVSYIGKLCALLYERYQADALPLTLVSMDNCSHNGDKLKDAVCAFADAWSQNHLVEPGFAAYLRNDQIVAFPLTMIDKITPRPDEAVQEILTGLGLENMQGQVTSKNTFIAPFVNAEETQWLVIEDIFTNGRPPLEAEGVLFASRDTVDKVEKMKVCTCLNPIHTALAIFGCLLGYTKISEEMKDPDLVRLAEQIGYKEGLPVVVDPEILDPKAFIDNVLQVRLPNPFMPDTPQRIACDTSQKLAIRFGETIKAYLKSDNLDVQSLTAIPLVLAAWVRYLLGVQDDGQPFEVSPDPLLEALSEKLAGIGLGSQADHETLASLFSDPAYFGVNLYEAGLGEKTEALFQQLITGPGAVRAALQAL